MENKYNFFLLLLLTFFLCSTLSAQEVGVNDVDEDLIDVDQPGILSDDGIIFSNFYNSDRQLEIRTRLGAENHQSGSYVYIEQQGSDNVTEWVQEGPGNAFIIRQQGDCNVHRGYLRGENNLINVLQLGQNNTLTQEYSGNDIAIVVFQEGNNHELLNIEKSSTSPAYQIHQQGDHGMKVIIQHEQGY